MENEQTQSDTLPQPDSAQREKPEFGPIIRIIEVYFVLVMVSVLGYGLVSKPADFTYDISMLRVIAVMIAAARSIWLIEKRANTTRMFVIVSMSRPPP